MTFERALRSSEPVLQTMQFACCVARLDSYSPCGNSFNCDKKGEIQGGCLRVVSIVYLCSTISEMYWLCDVVISYHVRCHLKLDRPHVARVGDSTVFSLVKTD